METRDLSEYENNEAVLAAVPRFPWEDLARTVLVYCNMRLNLGLGMSGDPEIIRERLVKLATEAYFILSEGQKSADVSSGGLRVYAESFSEDNTDLCFHFFIEP
jgi:hypothetical protein